MLSVVTGSNRTVIDWTSFSIGLGEVTQITQPGANSATLNRVIGTMPSEILGSLISNGKVALINQHGILVGSTGVIDTHGFIGSTLDVSNEAFMASGDLVFSGDSQATIENQGSILAREGDVFLLGRNVINSNSIEATNGNVGLAAGGEIVLRKAADENVYVEIKSSENGNAVVNSGTIRAIQQDLRENSANPYGYAINAGKDEPLTAQFVPGGGVFLGAGGAGSVTHSGTIQASKGETGGTVEITAREVTLKAGSVIDADGSASGGSVHVGKGVTAGESGETTNSLVTRVEEGALIHADATGDGDGGDVVVWSDGATLYRGSLSAKGAGQGSGGNAEVSGALYLQYRGGVDLSAASGVNGSLLIDPANITIQASLPDLDGDLVTGDDVAAEILAGTFAGADSVITAGAVEGLLAVTDLSLAATDSIVVNESIDWNSASALTLTTTGAGSAITLNAGITNLGTGGINLSSGGDITVGAAASTAGNLDMSFGQAAGGTFALTGAGSLTGAAITVTGGAGDDTVDLQGGAFGTALFDLAGGSNTLELPDTANSLTLTAANTVAFGSATVQNISTVNGGTASDGLVNSVAGETFAAETNSAGGVTFNAFETVDTALLSLTGTDDIFTVTGAGAGTHTGGLSYTGLADVDALGGAGDVLVNDIAADAFDAETDTVGGVAVANFETVDTALLTLTGANDTFTITGAGAGTHTGGLAYTGLTSVDALGAAGDVLVNDIAAEAYAAETNSVGGVAVSNFETVDTALLSLTNADDTFTVTGAGAGTHTGGLVYTGLTNVDGLGGAGDALVNANAGEAFAAETNSVNGVAVANFETVETALLTLTGADDTFTITGAGTGAHTGGMAYTGLTDVDALSGTGDTLVNDIVAEAYAAQTNTVGGVAVANFETVDTALLTLTGADDTFTITGAGAGNHTGGLAYTGLTNVDALGAGGDVIVNDISAEAYAAETNSVGGVAVANFETVDTALLSLTSADDTFTVTGAGAGTHTGGLVYTGLTNVDGLGGAGDALVNANAGEAFAAETNSVNGVAVTNFETAETALLTLTGADDTFTITGAGTGSHTGGMAYTGLTDVDALGGTGDTLVNDIVADAFDAETNAIGGVTVANFETVDTALLTLTSANDTFTITGAGAGSHTGGLAYTGLTNVDGLGAADDVLVNDIAAEAYNAETNTVGSVAALNFETVDTALLALTSADDTFTITGAGAGTHTGGLTYTGLSSVDALGNAGDALVNDIAAEAFAAQTNSVGGVAAANFETVDTALLTLTSANDTFTVTGAGTGNHTGGLAYTGLSNVDGLGGTGDAMVNGIVADAFAAETNSVGGVVVSNFETVDTALLTLTSADDTFTITGSGAGSHTGGMAYTGLTDVDALGATGDVLVNDIAAEAYDAETDTLGGITVSNFETVDTALLTLTGADDIFTITGAGAGTHTGGLNYTGLTNVDALGAAGDVLVNDIDAEAFAAQSSSVGGVTAANFETVDTALLSLTGADDTFTITSAGTGNHTGGLSYTGLTNVDGLGETGDALVNGIAAEAFAAQTKSVGGVTVSNFETVDTALLTLTSADDTFTITGTNTGNHTGGLAYTGLTNVDALGAAGDVLVNDIAGEAYAAETDTVGGVTAANFETVDTALLTLTGADDTFTITGAGAGTHTGGLAYTGLTNVDALGAAGDVLVNDIAGEAYDAETDSVGGVTAANFETVDTALLSLTSADDTFTITGAGAGTHTGGLAYTGLTNVDAQGGGGDLLVNDIVAEAFAAQTNSVGGVTIASFETVDTALLTLTSANDTFTITGANTGNHIGGLNYTGLNNVDALGDSGDLLVNGIAGEAFAAQTNSVGGVTAANFETVQTALLTLTSSADIFTITAAGTGNHTGGLNYIGLTDVDALGDSDLLVNDISAEAFAAQTLSVGGVTVAGFETVDTERLTLTTNDDTFDLTGTSSGTHAGGLDYIGLLDVNALSGVDTINLTDTDNAVVVNGTKAATTSGVSFTDVEILDTKLGTDSVELTAGDDTFELLAPGQGRSNDIEFRGIENLDGSGGTNTFVGTSGTEDWQITGADQGLVAGIDFQRFSELRSGGTAIDRLTFLAGGDVTGSIIADSVGGGALSSLQLVNSGIATMLSGSLAADGVRFTSAAGGSFSATNAGNSVSVISADLDGSLVFLNNGSFTVGTVDGVSGITTTGDPIDLDASAAGNITLASNVTTQSPTAGDVSFRRAVRLATGVTVTGGNVLFAGTVDGAHDLTVNSDGNTRFENSVGATEQLASLTTDTGGTTIFSDALTQVRTSGAQIYGDDLAVGVDATLNAASADFQGTVDSLTGAPGSLVVSANGDTTFRGAVGGGLELSRLETTGGGTTHINGGSVTTTGDQRYDDAVRLGTDTVLAGSDVRFTSTVDSTGVARDLTVNASNETVFGGNVGSGSALDTITTDAPGTTILGSGATVSVTTTGDQTYGDDVRLVSNATITGNDIRFDGTVGGADLASAKSLVITHVAPGRQVTFGDTVQNITNLLVGSAGSFIRDSDGKLTLENVLGGDLLGTLNLETLELRGDIGTGGRLNLLNSFNQVHKLAFSSGSSSSPVTVGDFRFVDNGAPDIDPPSGIPGLSSPGLVLTGNATVKVRDSLTVVTEDGIHVMRQGNSGIVFDKAQDDSAASVILVAGTSPGSPGTNEFRNNDAQGININGSANLYIVANSIGTETDGSNFIGSDFSGMVPPNSPFRSTTFNYTLPGGTAAQLAETLGSDDFGTPDALHLFGAGPVIDTGGSDVAALVRAFFNDFLSTTNLVSGDAESIVEIGKLARFESGLFPPLYGPFSVTSYEHEWYEKEISGEVPDEKKYYNKKYPLYLKQGGTPPEVEYRSIIEDN